MPPPRTSPTMKNSSSAGVIARRRPPSSGASGTGAAATGTSVPREGGLACAASYPTGGGSSLDARVSRMPDERTERVARNEAAFRELNESLEASVHRRRTDDDLAGFLCECGDPDCDMTVRVTL